MDKKIRVALFLGGRSTEHEVSVISALQAYQHLDKNKYEVIPVYTAKDGQFYTNAKFLDLRNYTDVNKLILSADKVNLSLANKDGQPGFYTQKLVRQFTPFDIAFPIFHGSFGEDGAIQGLFEMYQIPYVGLGVTGSAIAMDKVAAKAVFAQLGLPIGKFYQIRRLDWIDDQSKCLKQIKANLKFPMFVKPSTGGSSIGINKAIDDDSLTFAIEVASAYSEKILIEEAFKDVIEVNCSALGYKEIESSVCEMPVSESDILTFADKYQKGGKSKSSGMASLSRIIPAPISSELRNKIQETTIKVFKALDGCGVARIDFFVNQKTNQFWINEVNSPPGSLAFYLWEKSGVSFKELLDRMVSDGLKRFQDRSKTQYTLESGLLKQIGQAGIKS